MRRNLRNFLRQFLHNADQASREEPTATTGPRTDQNSVDGALVVPFNLGDWISGQADVATSLWRLRRRMIDPKTGQPLEEMRKCYRDLESAWDALARMGIEIQDHVGAIYDPGQRLQVIEFQPVAGATADTILETIRPTIYFEGQPIQLGQVIVGIPGPTGPLPENRRDVNPR